MQYVRFGLAMVAVATASGCHPDACVWSVERVRDEMSAALTRDGIPLTVASVSAGAGSFQSQRTGERSTRFYAAVAVESDPAIETLVVELDLGDPTAPATLDLANLDRAFRVVVDSTVVAEGLPTGVLTLEYFAAPCELSDTYRDTSSHWDCAANIDATIDATLETATTSYHLVGTLSQREELTEECHECGGIEGCDY